MIRSCCSDEAYLYPSIEDSFGSMEVKSEQSSIGCSSKESLAEKSERGFNFLRIKMLQLTQDIDCYEIRYGKSLGEAPKDQKFKWLRKIENHLITLSNFVVGEKAYIDDSFVSFLKKEIYVTKSQMFILQNYPISIALYKNYKKLRLLETDYDSTKVMLKSVKGLFLSKKIFNIFIQTYFRRAEEFVTPLVLKYSTQIEEELKENLHKFCIMNKKSGFPIESGFDANPFCSYHELKKKFENSPTFLYPHTPSVKGDKTIQIGWTIYFEGHSTLRVSQALGLGCFYRAYDYDEDKELLQIETFWTFFPHPEITKIEPYLLFKIEFSVSKEEFLAVKSGKMLSEKLVVLQDFLEDEKLEELLVFSNELNQNKFFLMRKDVEGRLYKNPSFLKFIGEQEEYRFKILRLVELLGFQVLNKDYIYCHRLQIGSLFDRLYSTNRFSEEIKVEKAVTYE